MPARVPLGVLYAPTPCPHCNRASPSKFGESWQYTRKGMKNNGSMCGYCDGYGFILQDVSHLKVRT